MFKINIAIDGPSAAGKSTIAKKLAERLCYVHLDTGAMYRCVGYKALKENYQLEDEKGICELLKNTDIRLTPDGKVFLDGADVSKLIRRDEISQAASKVSSHQQVRADLVARQQQMAAQKGFIMDGRDIGTVVLKDAEVKIYLTASAHARALRRMKQNQEEHISNLSLEQIEKEIEERDYRDMHRAASPLKKADDAFEIDSSNCSIDEVLDQIYHLVEPYLTKEEMR